MHMRRRIHAYEEEDTWRERERLLTHGHDDKADMGQTSWRSSILSRKSCGK